MIAAARNGMRRYGLNALLFAAILGALWGPGGNSAATDAGAADPDRAIAATPNPGGEEVQAARRAALERALEMQGERDPGTVPAERQIAQHLDQLARTGEPGEQAARLCALGNLHMQQRGDFAAAAGYYERVIEEHPQWEGAHAAYGLLLTCYKRLGDAPRERLLYRNLLERFPEDSPPAELARNALGLGPGPIPPPDTRPKHYFD